MTAEAEANASAESVSGAEAVAPSPMMADEEWIVSGTRVPVADGRRPFQATALTGEQLDAGISPSVVDALRFVPGLHVVQEGAPGGRAALSLRGLDPNHVVVLVDGVRVNDPTNSRGGSFDPSTLALVDIEKIEIVRGPLSSIHGADALAGVVQIVTRRVEADAPLRGRGRVRGGRVPFAGG
jgi:vitamin B12 transporter